MSGAEHERGARRLSLSRETLRDLEPSAELTAAVRGGQPPPTAVTFCGCPTGGVWDYTRTETMPGGVGGGLGGGFGGTAACKGTIKVSYEIELNVTASPEYAARMKREGGDGEGDGHEP